MDLQEKFLLCWVASVGVSVLLSVGLTQSSCEKINALEARVQALEQSRTQLTTTNLFLTTPYNSAK